MSKDDTKPPRRQAVLVAVYPDGFLEAFAGRSIDVKFVRLPVAHGRVNEILAEQCFELMLPLRYRDLWRRDLLRANGTSRPLKAQVALDALAAKDSVATLDPFMPPKPKKGTT